MNPKCRKVFSHSVSPGILIASLLLVILGVTTGSTRTVNAESRIGSKPDAHALGPHLERARDEFGMLIRVPNAPNAGGPVGSSFAISAGTEQEVSPAIAYNPDKQEYIVAWYNDLPGNDDIHVELVSKNGVLVKHTCVACGVGAERRYPDVTYNSQRNEYLVVWVEEASGVSLVKAQRLSSGAVLQGSEIVLYAGPIGTLTSANPAVAYASTADKYLIVWQLETNIPPAAAVTSIVGYMMSSGGVLDPAGSFTISQDPGGSPRVRPDLAYNRHGNGYLVVWQENSGASAYIHGQLVNGGGGLYQGNISIGHYPTMPSTAPAVAAIPTTPTNDKYAVVFELLTTPGIRIIFGQLVSETGTLGMYFYPSSGSASGGDESSPAAAGSESNSQYLVTWRENVGIMDKPIKGSATSYAGGSIGQVATFEGLNTDYPGVASGPAGEFLLAWQDQPISATSRNLYGQIWGNRLFLPIVLR